MTENTPDTTAVWDRIAGWWDDYIGPAGNEFHRLLIEPATDRLLSPRPGQRILDLACGNGQYARHLASLGCSVLAVDGSSVFIDRARQHTNPGVPIEYRQLDLADPARIASLPDSFDAAVCNMALMDIADIGPLLTGIRPKLRPGAPFVFSISHPCFNSGTARMTAELANDAGATREIYGVSVRDYLTPIATRAEGILGQPEGHWMFHRPLSAILREAFRAGWIMDSCEEPQEPRNQISKSAFSWSKRPDIPPAIVIRLRTTRHPVGAAHGTNTAHRNKTHHLTPTTMTTTPLVASLKSSLRITQMMCQDLSPADLLHRPCPKANCAAWILGHLVLTERNAAKRAGATELPALPEAFEKRFSREEDAPIATDFGDTSILLPLLTATREATIAAIEKSPPEFLSQPLEKPHPWLGSTVGEILSFGPVHMATHAGQLSTIRRSLGRPPII